MKTIHKLYILSILASTLTVSCLKEDTNYAEGTRNPESSIYVLRNLYKGNDVALDTEKLNGANHFKCLVISNAQTKNFPTNVVAVQNTWRGQTRGILIEVPNGHNYQFGDSLRIDLANPMLSKFNELLVLKGISETNITKLNSGNKVQSKSVSVATLKSKFPDYESTFVGVTADLATEPENGTPIKGARPLVDSEKNNLVLFTADDATFSEESIAPSATFTGVAFRNTNDIELRLQSYADMRYPSGRVYAGWPENFDTFDAAKDGYAARVVKLATGDWMFDQSLLGFTPGRDRIVSGTHAVRFQQNLKTPALLQMIFDVPNGASKVTLWYGCYWNDRSSSFALEYSQDNGKTWTQTGEIISDATTTTESMTPKQAVFLMNIQGPVRFRINKLGLGGSTNEISNGRLGIDDIAIFRSY